MTAVVLHLSDIHIKTAQDPILKRQADIARSVYPFLPPAQHVFIVVSGDISYSGLSDQFDLSAEFLEQIRGVIKKEKDVPVTFILVPGNHDCDFNRNSSARKLMVKNFESSDPPEVDESIVEICTEVQKAFFRFRARLEDNETAIDDRLWRTSQFVVEGKTISFESLNISWVSNIREEPGRLFFPVNRYLEKKTNVVDLRLVVLHHPLNWFNQSIYKPFKGFIRQMATIIFSGHEHQGNVGVISDAESNTSAFVEGCVLQRAEDLSDSSFNIVILDLEGEQFSSTRYTWGGTRYMTTEEGSWSHYHDLPVKRENPFPLDISFQNKLDDPGAFFKHPGKKNITLSDIFIYPDLREIGNENNKKRDFISSKKLLSPNTAVDGVLIEGEEKSGRTSLIHYLYRQYHEQGLIPILIQGKELRKATDDEIHALIKRTVEAQYGVAYVPAFEQTSSSNKFLLINDFDHSPIKASDGRARLLRALKTRFAYLIASVGETFELRELLNNDSSQQLFKFTHYQLQPFGYVLRSQLTQRWLSLGADGSIDEATFIARCDEAERLMDSVMTKKVIPPLPLYLLTLLQSMDAGRIGDFKESALGYYYQYLLTEAFQNSGVKPEKLTEIFQYAAYLAWEFHSHDKKELSEIELRKFNTRFSQTWVTVDFARIMEIFVSARVLCQVGDDYAFRYPYIYYYLKGQYLSENLNDLDIRGYIKHCIKHLYVRDYANTVLFLAHHTNDEYVLRTIEEALHMLFRSNIPVTLDKDPERIKRLITDAPKLIYSGEAPAQYRERSNELKDEMHNENDGLADAEEESENISLLAQINMLYKTTEILGQILKNQYAKIQRPRKVDLLEELFNGPLRAIHNFFEYFEKNPDAFIAHIEAKLDQKGKAGKEEERKAAAPKVVASMLQLVSFAFILRAAQAASSENLLEDVRETVRRNNTVAFKLIELYITLDSPKGLPREKLKSLYKEAKNGVVAGRLLNLMVLNRLHMFKTTEKDMQWLSDELKINIEIQHKITYQGKKQKLLRSAIK